MHRSSRSAKLVVCAISFFMRKYMQWRASQKASPSAVIVAESLTISSTDVLVASLTRLSLYEMVLD